MTNNYASECLLIGINLVSDAFTSDISHHHHHSIHDDHLSNKDNSGTPFALHENVIGFVNLRSLTITLNEFKNIMFQQIGSLPSQFMFLSKQRWPVSLNQESSLTISSIIDNKMMMVLIRRKFDKQRFGVQLINEFVIGFIFAEMEDTASHVHELIDNELHSSIGDKNSFVLIDINGWPVMLDQENEIKVWDLIIHGMFRIMIIKSIGNDVIDHADIITDIHHEPNSIKKRKRSSGGSTIEIESANRSTIEGSSEHNVAHSVEDQFLTSKNLNHSINPFHTSTKPILISYVRNEAEQHARQLKTELNDLGCQVFLDVDEIECGHDWQDALNNAVLNCDLFVPLITPNYGYTLWTNREVKLADIKQKQIVPISFLDHWPPECLAIQFASTQYISWKSQADFEKAEKDGEGERAKDIRFWDQPFVRNTAKAIAGFFKSIETSGQQQSIEINKPQIELITNIEQTSIEENIWAKLNNNNNTEFSQNHHVKYSVKINNNPSILKRRKSIVISAHPKQSDFVSLIRNELSKLDFDVWSSTDMIIGTNNGLETNFSSQISNDFTPDLIGNNHNGEQTLLMSESSQESQLNPIFNKPPRLTFSLSNEQINYPQCSQYEHCGSQTSIFSPEDFNKAQNFRNRVDEARIVIIVLSKSYCDSRTCKTQAFYCDFRKEVIAIKVEDSNLPHWVLKLYDDDIMEKHNKNYEEFLTQLKQRVRSIISESRNTFKSAMTAAKIDSLADYLGKNLLFTHSERKKIFIYITGSTKFYCPLSEAICRAIGQALASIPFVILVTSGCYGVAEITGRSFCEERELIEKPASLYHILPKYDSQDLTFKSRQSQDGTFQKIPFGHTLFIGDSFKDRDSVAARVFNYCILIEGGPRSARIAEEFTWNDNIVIPIMCTGGAAAGGFGIPEKIQEVPMGVHKDDWSTLIRRDVTAENIADAVKNIICSLVKCRSNKKAKERHHPSFKVAKSRKYKSKAKR